MTNLSYRTYGSSGPLAEAIGEGFRVVEPFQRGSGDVPLTVAQHVTDLHRLIESFELERPPAIVGHSWGAMLALAYAAEYPMAASSLALIGCGTFDPASRRQLVKNREERQSSHFKRRIAEIKAEVSDEAERMGLIGEMYSSLDLFDTVELEIDAPPFDAIAYQQTWDDMMRLQDQGVYPTAFSAVTSPAIMLHGTYDPAFPYSPLGIQGVGEVWTRALARASRPAGLSRDSSTVADISQLTLRSSTSRLGEDHPRALAVRSIRSVDALYFRHRDSRVPTEVG